MPPKPTRRFFARWKKKVSREMGLKLSVEATQSHRAFLDKTGWPERETAVLRGKRGGNYGERLERIERMGRSSVGKHRARRLSSGKARHVVFSGKGQERIAERATLAHELGHAAYLQKHGNKRFSPKSPKRIVSEMFGIHYELEFYRLNHPSLYRKRLGERKKMGGWPHKEAMGHLSKIYSSAPTQAGRKKILSALAEAEMNEMGELADFLKAL